jgi:hypothetical protein
VPLGSRFQFDRIDSMSRFDAVGRLPSAVA